MKSMTRKQWGILVVVLIPLIPLGLQFLGLFTWSRLNCVVTDVDISSGRIRITRYFYYFQISSSIRDTVISEPWKDSASMGRENWQTAFTLSPFVSHSPHYVYHGAVGQIGDVGRMFKARNYSPEAKRLVSSRLLKLWQRKKGDKEAREFLQKLSDLTFSKHEDETIQAEEIPPI